MERHLQTTHSVTWANMCSLILKMDGNSASVTRLRWI